MPLDRFINFDIQSKWHRRVGNLLDDTSFGKLTVCYTVNAERRLQTTV
jgi:hypothetical protein